MLVLSRKTGETIQIGNNVTITVLGVQGGVVKIGINAPRDVRILPGELAKWDVSLPREISAAETQQAVAV